MLLDLRQGNHKLLIRLVHPRYWDFNGGTGVMGRLVLFRHGCGRHDYLRLSQRAGALDERQFKRKLRLPTAAQFANRRIERLYTANKHFRAKSTRLLLKDSTLFTAGID